MEGGQKDLLSEVPSPLSRGELRHETWETEHTALFRACLDAGSTLVPESFELAKNEAMPHQRRQSALLKILSMALTVWSTEAERSAYVTYHRDWLVRSSVLAGIAEPAAALHLLEYFGRKARPMNASSFQALRAARKTRGSESFPERLLALRHALASSSQERRPALDPFTTDPFFPVVFSLLHAIANRLGLSPLDESFAYHIVLCSFEGEEPSIERFELIPGQRELLDSGPSAADTPEDDLKFNFEKDYDWAALVQASGVHGRRWMNLYRTEGEVIQQTVQEAVLRLRERAIQPGQALLLRACVRWRALRRKSPSHHFLLGRYLFGGLAYLYYVNEDYDRAEWAIGKVLTSIQKAVQLDGYLLPFAVTCVDVFFKKAQIARARRRWDDMHDCLWCAREVMKERRPLCILEDGRRIHHATIADSLATRLPMDGEYGLALRYLRDEWIRERMFRRMAAKMYLLPGYGGTGEAGGERV